MNPPYSGNTEKIRSDMLPHQPQTRQSRSTKSSPPKCHANMSEIEATNATHENESESQLEAENRDNEEEDE